MIGWLIGWLVDCCYWSAKVFVLGLFIAALGLSWMIEWFASLFVVLASACDLCQDLSCPPYSGVP